MFSQSVSAKPQQRPKKRRLSPLLTNFGKKSLPLHRRRFKSLIYFFALIFFTLTLAKIFVSASFAKGLKSEGERLKAKCLSFEMVKIFNLILDAPRTITK